MKGNLAQLDQSLKQSCLPIYLLASNEVVLQQDAVAIIRARVQAFNIKQIRSCILQEEADWAVFHDIAKQPDLFSPDEPTLWIMTCHKDKLTAQESAYLLDYVLQPTTSNVVVLCLSKLDPHAHKNKWYLQLEKIGMVVALWPPRAYEWNDWLMQRLKQAKVSVSPIMFAKIAYNTQGHLLAATQFIEKLVLLQSQQALDDETILALCVDQAEVDLYTWLDSWLSGSVEDSLRLWYLLRRQGLELSLIVWTLMKTLQDLLQSHQGISNFPAWRMQVMKQAARRYQPEQCKVWLQQLQILDSAIKQNEPAQLIADRLTMMLYTTE